MYLPVSLATCIRLIISCTSFTLVDHALRRDVAKTWQDLSLNEDVVDMQCYTLNLGPHVNHLFEYINSELITVSFYLYMPLTATWLSETYQKPTGCICTCNRAGDMSTKQDVPERVVELNMLGKGSRRGQNNWVT